MRVSGFITFIVCLFMLQSLGRMLYINHYEFWPAAREWHAAKDRGDIEGMERAYQKEIEAHNRTFDPFWFVPALENNRDKPIN